MNENIRTGGTTHVPWPTSHPQQDLPDTSMLPDADPAAPAMVDLVNHAAQGAHDTIDRLADRAAPVAQQLGERVSAAGATLEAKAGELRDARDEWVERTRTTVRGRPLLAIVAAFALGALVSRITR